MKQSLFQPGQKAKHLGAHVKQPNRQVTIVECINADEPDDVLGYYQKDGTWNPGQGFRYYVNYKGQIWSVPEAFLRTK